jgi:hypothetical protein
MPAMSKYPALPAAAPAPDRGPEVAMDVERRARLGARWTCAECGTAFYDLGQAEAVCPKCSAKQPEPAARPASKVKRKRKETSGRYLTGSRRERSVRDDSVRPEAADDDDELDSDEEEEDS